MTTSVVIMGSLLMTPIVPGKPFVAEYERRVSRAGHADDLEHGTVAVDGQGRARTAIEMPGSQSVAAIWDPMTKAAWIVDRSNRVLMDIPWPKSSSTTPALAPLEPIEDGVHAATVHSLGVRTIDGLDCDGTRTSAEAPKGREIIERWISRDLGHVVLETRSNDQEQVTFRMFEIKRGDPDPGMFVPRP